MNLINNNYKVLKESLIFQMSLGSKELFHSNVWAWLIEQDHNFVKVFFEGFDFDKYEYVKVEREKYHRDLIIWVKEKSSKKEKTHYLVVENKIKSLPSEDQIKKYSSEKLDKCDLLGAVITGFDDYLQNKTFENITWNFVSYLEIADRIERILSRSLLKQNANISQQIMEYCKIIRALNDLIGTELDKIGDSLIVDQWDEKYAIFKDLRIADLLKKANGAKFIRYLKKHCESELKEGLPSDYKLLLRQGFHNNKVTIDIFYTNADEKETNDFFIIGTQTEGKQYRIVACRSQTHYKHGENGAEQLFNELKGEWFEETFDKKNNRLIHGNQTSMSKKYDSYKPNAFVYQYYNIEDNSFENLYAQIKKDLKIAKKIIKKEK